MEMNHAVYCDVVAGELIFFFHEENQIAADLLERIRRNELMHIEIIESMADKLSFLGLEQEGYFHYQLFLLRVPEGSEIMKINWLFEEHQLMVARFISGAFQHNNQVELENATSYVNGDRNTKLLIVPNSYYSLNSTMKALHCNEFTFTEIHEEYKRIMHFERMLPIENYHQVLIIDSGIAEGQKLNILKEVNFLAAYQLESDQAQSIHISNLPYPAVDENGHGTAIANILNDICPNIPLLIFKIVDASGRSTEWNLLAAIIAKNDAKVINISLSYGFPKLDCRSCGRLSRSTRSYVMEYALAHTHHNGGKIIVASAGNANADIVDFPARFDYAVGVVALNKTFQKSSYSNFGIKNFWGDTHPYIVTAPGGEEESEPIFYSPLGINGWGTSFAAAYVTALIAYIWSRCPQVSSNDNEFILSSLKYLFIDKNFENFREELFGNGIISIQGNSNQAFEMAIDRWKRFAISVESSFSVTS
jgi:hypothetical protein